MRKLTVLLVLVTIGMFVGAGAAYAATWQRTTDGSSVVFNNNVPGTDNDERFRVCDTDSDGNAVYVEYSYNNGSLVKRTFSGGNGGCANYDYQWAENKVVRFRSCEEIDNWPNDCSYYEESARS